MFIPALIAVIPYIMAFVQVLTEMAQSIANFFGFKIPTIDYSSLGGAQSALSDVGETAADAGKEVKGLLGSFDELNIIGNQASGAGGKGAGAGGSLGIALPEYDALLGKGITDNLEKIKQKIKDFIEELKPFLPLITGIGAALLTAFAVTKLAPFIGFIGNLVGSLLGLKKGFLGTLSPIQKITTGLALLVGGFITVTGAAEKAKLGQLSLNEAMIQVLGSITAMGIGGALIGSIFGPIGTAVGLIAGGLIGLTAEVIGFNNASKKLGEANVFGTMTISAETLNIASQSIMGSLALQTESFNKYKASIATMTGEFNTSLEVVDQYGIRFGLLNQDVTQKDLPQILKAITDFGNNSTKVIDESTNASISLWSGMFERTGTITIQEQKDILQTISKGGKDRKTEIASITKNINTIWQTASNENRDLSDEEYKYIEENMRKIKELTTQEAQKALISAEIAKKELSDTNNRLTKKSYEDLMKTVTEGEAASRKAAKDIQVAAYLDAETRFKGNTDKIKIMKQTADIDYQMSTAKSSQAIREILSGTYSTTQTQLDNLNKIIIGNGTIAQQEEKKLLLARLADIKKFTGDYSAYGINAGSNFGTNMLKGISNTDGFWEAGKNSAKAYINAFSQSITGARFKTNEEMRIDSTSGSAIRTFSIIKYATGGFPDQGQMFMANEAGPELVGKIGNRTAVVNNNQIVDSVAQGVASAISGVIGGGNNNQPIIINLGNETLYNSMTSSIKSKNNQFGYNVIQV